MKANFFKKFFSIIVFPFALLFLFFGSFEIVFSGTGFGGQAVTVLSSSVLILAGLSLIVWSLSLLASVKFLWKGERSRGVSRWVLFSCLSALFLNMIAFAYDAGGWGFVDVSANRVWFLFGFLFVMPCVLSVAIFRILYPATANSEVGVY